METKYGTNIISYDETQKNINYGYQKTYTEYQPLNIPLDYQEKIISSQLKFSNQPISSQLENNYPSNSLINRRTFYPFPDDLSKKCQIDNQYNYLDMDTYHDESTLPATRLKKQPYDSLFDNKSINSIVNFLPNKTEIKINQNYYATDSSGSISSGGFSAFKNHINVNNIYNSNSVSKENFKKISKIEKINNISDIKKQKSYENSIHLKNKTFCENTVKIRKKTMDCNYNNCENNNSDENNNPNFSVKENINNKLIKDNMMNQFVNRNIATQIMLKKINFFEKLKAIGNERMKYFEQRYNKDYYFMNKEYFDNIFINENDIKNRLPLTLVFYYIFNPETNIKKLNLNKSFFESIFLLRGDTNLTLNYKKSKLLKVPKFFNDLDYVNHLFNDFDEIELNKFLNEIDNWQNTFKFELQFVHPLKQIYIAKNKITMKDVAKIYFISPTDLIVDYHSFASDFPMSDKFISITQYRFHCDIKFNGYSGKFEFKTSAVVYNKLQVIKKAILENELKIFANKNNEEELKIHTWEPFRFVIENQSIEDNAIWDELFEKNIEKIIKNYSVQIPKDASIDNDNFENDNNNNVTKKDKIQNKKNQKKEPSPKNSEMRGGIKLFGKKKTVEKKDDKNVEDSNCQDEEENKLISYGAFITFFLFILKTVLSIEGGYISKETIFNIIIIIIISKMLVKVHFVDE